MLDHNREGELLNSVKDRFRFQDAPAQNATLRHDGSSAPCARDCQFHYATCRFHAQISALSTSVVS